MNNLNPLSFYSLDVVWPTPNVGAFEVNCQRCGLKARTTVDGPYKRSPDLTMLINTHICDPSKRGGV